MALITSNGQRIRLARRKPVNMRMQGAYQGADGEPGQGLQAGMFSRKPEDSPLRGPYETGCVSPGRARTSHTAITARPATRARHVSRSTVRARVTVRGSIRY